MLIRTHPQVMQSAVFRREITFHPIATISGRSARRLRHGPPRTRHRDRHGSREEKHSPTSSKTSASCPVLRQSGHRYSTQPACTSRSRPPAATAQRRKGACFTKRASLEPPHESRRFAERRQSSRCRSGSFVVVAIRPGDGVYSQVRRAASQYRALQEPASLVTRDGACPTARAGVAQLVER